MSFYLLWHVIDIKRKKICVFIFFYIVLANKKPYLNMINIKVQVQGENLDKVLALLKESGLTTHVEVDDVDDALKPMTATDFYKRINASNLAQKEKRLFTQKEVEQEVQSW